MKTKKILLQITLFASLLGIVACTEKFLDPTIPQVDEELYFNSEKNAQLALTGCYSVLGWDDSNFLQFWLGDILGHDAHKGGEGAGDNAWIEPLLRFQYNANNEGLINPYKNYFIGVGRCNKLIDGVTKMSDNLIDADMKERIIAEAKFIRGYFYFELVRTYGKVPLVTKVLSPSEYKQPLAEISAIYAQIEQDFKDAALILPEKSEYTTEDMGRATKGAANAMLCKAYIYQEKWSEALAIAEEIINPTAPAIPQYHLESDYANNWAYPHENGPESVFEIQFGNIPGGSNWGDQNTGNVYSIFMRSRNLDAGWGFNLPNQNLYDEYEAGDPRRDATIITDGEILWPGTADEVVADNSTNWASNIDKMCNQKYQLPFSLQAENMSDDPNNWIVIRYAEVLLWAAEAAYHTGGDWQSYLTEVRDRVGLGASPYLADPVKAIFHERRCELAMEGHALWDIIRSGRGVEVLGQFGYTEANNHYFPIPQAQVDLGGF